MVESFVVYIYKDLVYREPTDEYYSTAQCIIVWLSL